MYTERCPLVPRARLNLALNGFPGELFIYESQRRHFGQDISLRALTAIYDTLKANYGAVTSTIGQWHNFLGIHRDFHVAGQVSLSMDGYVNDIITK